MTSFHLSDKEQKFITKAKKEGYRLELLVTDGGERGIIRAYKIKLSELFPNTWNPNRTEDRVKTAISESLNEFGQVLECVVRVHPEDEGFQIGDGEHRFKELFQTGKDDLISVNILFGYSDNEFKKLTIILNETRGRADKIELSSLLADLSNQMDFDALSLGLPYEPIELTELINLANMDWDAFKEDTSNEEKDNDSQDEGWTVFTVKVSNDAFDVINQSRDLVSGQLGLNKDKAIAWGQVLECLAADYLAR